MTTERKLPLLPLRGMIIFPYMIINLDVGRERSVAALEEAMVRDHGVMLIAQKNPDKESPEEEDLYEVGTVAEVRQLIKLPGGTMRVLVEGMCRARITNYEELEDFAEVTVVEHHDEIPTDMETEARIRGVVGEFEEWVKLSHKIPPDTLVSVTLMEDAGRLSDLIASHLNLRNEDRQMLLEALDIKDRLECLYKILAREIEVLEIEKKIGNRVRKQMEKIQKDYYLREQIKAIQKELGDDDDKAADIARYQEKIENGDYPEDVTKTIEKELRRLEQSSHLSAEAGVIRTYVEVLLELPWNIETDEAIDMKEAEAVLEKDHYGLEKVKERILEYLAVHKLTKNHHAPILCLVGPPGVGKTSLASSIAGATGRKFVRASLGGVRDEAEIRGHRRTYVGALPGRILEGIKKAGSKNPVFLLDEVDKIAMDYKGDPTAALLEVLDPAQNSTFSDHYVELPFDLSKVLWVLTANTLGNIPRALRDRVEVITLSSYTEIEKKEIAKRYLLARQREENGLKAKSLQLGAGVLETLISNYTREAGVRELERSIGHICRKAARKIVEDDVSVVRVTKKNLKDFLGRPKFLHTKAEKKPQVGVVTGMAWTETGGDILPTEVAVLPGKGKLILTGQLGDVMQESAQAALSYVRSRQEKFHIAKDFHENQDIHIHLPEGAIPKDGPSAGVTMATAMISALSGKKVRRDVAMTGEITLRGRVLAIGGLKEKVLAAYREGMRVILLPKENERDIEDIPEEVREKLEFFPVETMDEVLGHALL
ncbi:endopeptidase La [Selenomonas sp. TAMA-11512]|uniref:endopeptidase La n=1 Tax=Selenomonas sp. TAMA-11512 TaxID=3095337 RepID=UPI003084D0B2|nr:endopeptidase La [Selenomonas sp. TAMA-11512]